MIDLSTLGAKFLRARVLLAIGVGGGFNALMLKYSDPGAFTLTKAGIAKFAAVFVIGAIIALIHFFQTPPAVRSQ